MRTRVDRWGNSLGVRIPKALAERAGLREGDSVEIDIEDGAVVLRAADRLSIEQRLKMLEAAGVLGTAPVRRSPVPAPLDVDGRIAQQFLEQDRGV